MKYVTDNCVKNELLIRGIGMENKTFYYPGRAEAKESMDVSAAVALAEKIPMLNVNLSNYKYYRNPVLIGGQPGQWDEKGISRAVVYRNGRDDWRMWYDGSSADGMMQVGYATSPDGIRWTKYEGNPVLRPSETWEGQKISASSVVCMDGMFYLYYWVPGHYIPRQVKKICLAVSRDGITWEKKGIVLDADPPGWYESPSDGGSGVDAAKVFYMQQEARWYMIYTAFGAYGIWNGLAESKDGIQWTKREGPIISVRGPHNTMSFGIYGEATLRCPIQIGSLWVGMTNAIGGGLFPAVALSLDAWTAIGRSLLPTKQDYEPGPHVRTPFSIAVADEAFFIYYAIGGRQQGYPGIGLIRAPMHSVHQPMILWESERVMSKTDSMILEADRDPLTVYVASDREGSARLRVWNPADKSWLDMAEEPVHPQQLHILHAPSHARIRLVFRPAPGDAEAVVSAWATC